MPYPVLFAEVDILAVAVAAVAVLAGGIGLTTCAMACCRPGPAKGPIPAGLRFDRERQDDDDDTYAPGRHPWRDFDPVFLDEGPRPTWRDSPPTEQDRKWWSRNAPHYHPEIMP